MSKYKYKTELKNYDNESLATDKEESDFLNEHGELGWELVSVIKEDRGGYDTSPAFLRKYYFKKNAE